MNFSLLTPPSARARVAAFDEAKADRRENRSRMARVVWFCGRSVKSGLLLSIRFLSPERPSLFRDSWFIPSGTSSVLCQSPLRRQAGFSSLSASFIPQTGSSLGQIRTPIRCSPKGLVAGGSGLQDPPMNSAMNGTSQRFAKTPASQGCCDGWSSDVAIAGKSSTHRAVEIDMESPVVGPPERELWLPRQSREAGVPSLGWPRARGLVIKSKFNW